MNINQPRPNTIGFGNLTSVGFPVSPVSGDLLQHQLWLRQLQCNDGSGEKRLSHGLQLQSSYIYARNLSNLGGNPSHPSGRFRRRVWGNHFQSLRSRVSITAMSISHAGIAS